MVSEEIVPRKPDHVVSPTAGHLTAAELARIDTASRHLMREGRSEIHIHQPAPAPEYRGDDLLRRFLPYFVITIMVLVIIGGIAAILGMIIPVIMATIITLVGSLVSIILSMVATIIVAVIVALGITWCQSINRREEMEARRMDQG